MFASGYIYVRASATFALRVYTARRPFSRRCGFRGANLACLKCIKDAKVKFIWFKMKIR